MAGTDPHDYVSLSTYAWPDSAQPGGLPYHMRDGERNPECEDYDSPALEAMIAAVATLALAGWLLRRKDWSDRSAHLLRIWFLDPATAMRPNLSHAQMMPGSDTGHRRGIVDFAPRLLHLLDAATLAADSGAWDDGDHQTMMAWCDAFLGWLGCHPFGRIEMAMPNNHGTGCEVLVMGLCLFLNPRRRPATWHGKSPGGACRGNSPPTAPSRPSSPVPSG